MKLETIVYVVMMATLVVAVVAYIRTRDKLAALQGAREDHSVARSLRRHMAQIGHDRSALHDPSDTRELVLRTAISMLEADRGLLLGREDADGDGNLDVICALGFQGDPEPDPFVQSIGERTLNRDETVRHDHAVALPVYIADEFDGALICIKENGDFADFDDEVLLALGDHAGAVLDAGRLRGDLRSAYLGTIRALADAIEAKDPGVRYHSEDVARYAAGVAARLDLDPDRREALQFGSLLHDVGKIGISERILLKPGRLTEEEFNVIKLHPRIGHRIVAGIPALTGLGPAILHHHERFDGNGYPAGLAGERIPLEARIVGVADSFSAMIADRPYSQGRSAEEACGELERCAGTQFDPEVVRLFVEEVRKQPPAAVQTEEDSELAAHRDADHGPVGQPAYALVDGLTLLHSAPYLHERAALAAARERPTSLIVVDLAGLDAVNREQGFAAGDRLLIEAGAALRQVEAVTHGVACRLSGRRLALLVDGLARDAEQLVRDAVDKRCEVSSIAWEPGESGFDLVLRAQRAVKANRATPTSGRL